MFNQENKVESVVANNTEQTPKEEIKVVNSAKENLLSNSEELNDSEKVVKSQDLVPLSKLIEAGVHLGLKPNKWNPKMKHFIYAKKFNHIIDIKKIMGFLYKSFAYLLDVSKTGGEIVFVGTKNKLVRDLIKSNAKRVGSYYVIQRWLGGTFTNFKNISNSIKKLNDLEELFADEEKQKGRTKKELLLLTKEKEKLEKFYGGIKNMKKLPQVVVCFDPVEDINVIQEARKLNIPIVGVANTNANPDLIDFIIPANNFSVRSAYLLVNVLADAVAIANEQEPVIAYKPANEIILPELQRKRKPIGNFRPYNNFRKPYNSNFKNRNDKDGNFERKPFVSKQTTSAISENVRLNDADLTKKHKQE